MYTNILTVLRCPHCGAEFQLMESKREDDEIIEGKIVCEKGHAFYIHDGILDFQSQEQEIFIPGVNLIKTKDMPSLIVKLTKIKRRTSGKLKMISSTPLPGK